MKTKNVQIHVYLEIEIVHTKNKTDIVGKGYDLNDKLAYFNQYSLLKLYNNSFIAKDWATEHKNFINQAQDIFKHNFLSEIWEQLKALDKVINNLSDKYLKKQLNKLYNRQVRTLMFDYANIAKAFVSYELKTYPDKLSINYQYE